VIQQVIVALDGSEHSLKALDYAGAMAEKFGAKLILLHAYHPTSDLRGSEGFDQMVAKRKRAGEKIIQKAIENHLAGASFEMETDLLEGPAAEAIVWAADVRKADMVVMGTRGMGSFKGLLFGSVSTKVTHYAPCPVLVVR
jgi:nucleotide-binding universal stress UspA family protein